MAGSHVPFPQLTRTAPDMQNAPLAALHIPRHQLAHLGRLEQVQVELPGYGYFGWFGGLGRLLCRP